MSSEVDTPSALAKPHRFPPCYKYPAVQVSTLVWRFPNINRKASCRHHSTPTMITDGLKNAFRSKRLIYRAVENNEEDRHFLHTHIENDPVNTALADPNMIRPRSTKQAEGLIEELAKSTLAVMICLPADVDDRNSTDAGRTDGKADAATTPSQSSSPIGYIVLGWGGAHAGRMHHRTTEIGITLAAPYQGRGYGGEAINWALDWAFRFGGYHRVAIGTVSYNERAVKLYRQLGFVEEGRRRESHWHDRKWYDTVSFGMLEHEWAALRGIQE
jgi:RimJ/RimL family protein N-acetyltransferase